MILGRKKSVVGLDIGSSSIKLVELSEGKTGYKLQGLGACRRTPNNFVDSVDCSLKIEKSW